MALKVDTSLVNWEKMRSARSRIEVSPEFIDWKKVVETARSSDLSIEEVLGVPPVRNTKTEYSWVDAECARTGKSREQLERELAEPLPAFRALYQRAERLGVQVSDLYVIDALIVRYSALDKKDWEEMERIEEELGLKLDK